MLERLARITALGFLLAAPAALATTMLALSVDELTQRSDEVVKGRVTGLEPRASADGKRISTVVTLEVEEVWKGKPTQDVRILALGGTLDGISQKVMGAATFQEGEEVVVFLRRLPSSEPLTEVVGMAQGKLSVERNDDGTQVAVPSLQGLDLVEPGGVEKKPGPIGGPIPVTALQQKVQAATR